MIRSDLGTVRGALVAEMFEGAWRPQPPQLRTIPEALPSVLDFVCGSGAGPLLAHRLAASGFTDAPEVGCIFDAARWSERASRMHHAFMERVITRFADAGVPVLVGKGWVAAQLYARAHQRSYGDIDLYVGPSDAARARVMVADLPRGSLGVDLHTDASVLSPSSFSELYLRRRSLSLGSAQVTAFGLEDHLRLLALHALKHGMSRPIWCCDVAAAIEQAVSNFDRELCLGDGLTRHWMLTILGLAAHLLGARVPPCLRPLPVPPPWLVQAVHREWSRRRPRDRGVSRSELGSAERVWRTMKERWPNPLLTRFRLRARFGQHARPSLALPAYVGLEIDSVWKHLSAIRSRA